LGWFTKDKKVTRAVIELKDAKAQLDKKQNRGSEKLTPIEQAYLYATKYEGCNWIIVSNFKEIRLYNKHRTQEYYEKFDVIDLVQDAELKRFYFLLSKENLISKEKESVVDILAKDTTEAEQDITKKFYSEFREVRLKLLGHLSDNNPQFEKEILLEKTQKLLDRFIFTLFCEDTSTLLPLNLVKNTYERAINSLSPSDERVWTEFKGLFLAIDKGNDRVKPPINAYNGGLFAFDEILDTLSIKDDFWANLMHLTEYDFETDLNVNILGHIFEQSISDLESLKSELRGEEQDKKKSKRKKDGIFYTPEYITRYIVENTVGKYLEEHPDKLETIKILDPACGSGAFLNQAHSHLVQEYTNRYEARINEKLEKGESITLFDYNPAENNRNILLNNLYGVDLNRESVEITKLALWLKTARVTEPLQNLDKNIKAGNSLIDAPEIAGKKAFNWNNEFSEIMENGGFDVIIGNPPYVGIKAQRKEDRDYLKKRYELSGGADLYVTFIEKSLSLLKDGGYLSFICPNKFFGADYGRKIRKYLNESPDFQILSI
jgi:type I restriction-modification system DNA methylase subunit